eukprot:1257934-Rhodomonas_salina.2
MAPPETWPGGLSLSTLPSCYPGSLSATLSGTTHQAKRGSNHLNGATVTESLAAARRRASRFT